MAAEPLIPEKGRLVGDIVTVVSSGPDLQKLGPLHDPKLGEVLSLQQLVDQCFTFLWIGIGDKGIQFLLGREKPDDVEVDPPDEHFVGTDFGWDDTQFVKLLVNMFVDVVEFRELGTRVLQSIGNHDGHGTFGESVEAGHEEGFSLGL